MGWRPPSTCGGGRNRDPGAAALRAREPPAVLAQRSGDRGQQLRRTTALGQAGNLAERGPRQMVGAHNLDAEVDLAGDLGSTCAVERLAGRGGGGRTRPPGGPWRDALAVVGPLGSAADPGSGCNGGHPLLQSSR